eukprot:gnl/MRDRNA2_/MRDRNA2_18831_c0_seq1.p1 gnl/MRDRNA2_/MRDRNA2_18831_c0~~gnl/MRDRNA2_/MRDRNA2_18831_c0_seq1.p1  ORF type:complete len:621 (+),score=113.99 gnl/MRDRNA2_/MRDRNA2_18831_c0_seq1:3-1865(+)
MDLNDDEGQVDQAVGMKEHSCTDPLFLLVVIAFGIGMGMTLHYAFANGDIRRVYHGFDYKGQLCGVDPAVADKPNLFWCAKTVLPTGDVVDLDLAHPVCIEQCPTSDAGVVNCYKGVEVGAPVTIDEDTGSFKEERTYTFQEVATYKTYAFASRYCIPNLDDNAVAQSVFAQLKENKFAMMALEAAEVLEAKYVLIGAAVLAIILGYAYLIIIKTLARILVFACLAVLCIAPASAGAYLVYASQNGGIDGVPSTGDAQADLWAGIGCLVLSLIFTIVSFCSCHAIEIAIGCVEAACECMFSMPTLLLEPFFTLTVKLASLSLLLWGFFQLISCGQIQKGTLNAGVASVGGLSRSFVYKEEELYYILYYIFGIFWVMEIMTALAQFTLCYSVVLWYFVPKDESGSKEAPSFPLCRGYCVGVRFHLGSLAFGALLVAILRLIRAILGYLAKQAKDQENAAGECAAKACMCCVDCFKRFIEFLNKNAYIDMAINSNGYCTSAYNAFQTIMNNMSSIAILNGACWVFQLAGFGAITSAGVYLTWLCITTREEFTSKESAHYIHEPVVVCVAAGIICGIIAAAFMIVFDTVADTMLYCFAIDSKRKDKEVEYAPDSLKALVDGTE